YTRTVDVIKNIIERLINCFDFCILAMLNTIKEEKKIDTIPKSPGLRAKILSEHYKDEAELADFINFYHLLRSLSRAEFKRSNEFRRHVMMTAFLQDGPMEINIDIITEYYRKSKIFVRFVTKVLGKKEGEDFTELLRLAQVEVEFEGI
ncbi:hypothetical protein KY320_02440, partial [Candidatus Woesearchaeota archaeon]|nr:hypothetical protein [Candidatus Woesearchaeota archaeon]